MTKHGWLIIYHGVGEAAPTKLRYSAGVMVLSKEHPRTIRYRSAHPVLTPDLPRERRGIVANVVFPTGIDRRDDLGLPHRFDIYYGMADDRIGVACLEVPDFFWLKDSPTRPEQGYRVTFERPVLLYKTDATTRCETDRTKEIPGSTAGSWKDVSLC